MVVEKKEWSDCVVKQHLFGDYSCWAPKCCFLLFSVLKGMWVNGSNAIFQLLVCLPYKQDKLFSPCGVISLKLYIPLRKRILFFLSLQSPRILHYFKHHLATGSIQESELSNKNGLQYSEHMKEICYCPYFWWRRIG